MTLDLSGEADTAKENAKLEGVAGKVRVDELETPKFVYPDNHYDVVGQLVREMLRVIYDVLSTGDYAESLRSAGAQNVELSPISWPWCLPTRTVTARK